MKFGKSCARLTVPLLIILLGAWLRFHALAQNHRFHPDEALFSAFARAAAVNGNWMLPGALDKTPLAIYANALSQVFIGDNEFAARLPGTFANILLFPVIGALTYKLSKRLVPKSPTTYSRSPAEGSNPQLVQIKSTEGTPNASNNLNNPFSGFEFGQPGILMPGVAAFTMLLTALSPFAIAFSATAFTDGMMLLFMTLALWLIISGRWGWSGFALALGLACKQQALFYLPLVLALGCTTNIPMRHASSLRKRFLRFLLMFGLGIAALLIWDSARGGTSIFALAAANNDPWRLIRANEILPRLINWLNEAQLLLGTGWMTTILICVALTRLAIRVIREPCSRAVLIDLILLIFILAYGLLHWLIAFNIYDRYLLPILPPLILLVSRGLARMAMIYHAPTTRYFYHLAYVLLLIVVCAVMLFSAIESSEGRTTINDEYRQYEGIDELAAYLNSKPVATVIYDRWLGWELAYYMGQWTDKRRVYYPTPDDLVRGALALHEIGPRYLPAPAQQPITPWLEALCEARFSVMRVYDTSKFVVYEIIPSAGVSSVESSSPDLSESCADEFR